MLSRRLFLSRAWIAVASALILFAAVPSHSISAAKPKKTQNAPQKGKSKNTPQKGKTQSAPQKGKSKNAPKTSAEARRLQEAAQKDINLTKEKIKLNDQEIRQGLADLNELNADIKVGKGKLAGLNQKVASLEKEINSLNADIAKNEVQLQRMRDEYLKAVKKMRLNQKNQSMLAFIFASDDFNQALRRMRYVKQFSEWKNNRSKEINDKNQQLTLQKTNLSEAKKAHSKSLSELSATQKDLEAKHLKQQKLVDGLKQNGTALQKHLSQKQNEANQLKNSIAQLIAQEQAKAEAERAAREKALREAKEREAREKAEAERIAREKAEAERQLAEKQKKNADAKKKDKQKEDKKKKDRTSRKKDKDKNKDKKNKNQSPQEPATPKTTVAQVDFSKLQGNLPRPVDGNWRITNPFGRHSMPELPDVVYDNPGIDAEVAMGANVKSVAAGKVSGVYKVQGYGTVVIVNHGDYYTVYGNLSSVSVSVGSQLQAGGKIGNAAADPDDGRRGSVHFEVWRGREKLNPELWLR